MAEVAEPPSSPTDCWGQSVPRPLSKPLPLLSQEGEKPFDPCLRRGWHPGLDPGSGRTENNPIAEDRTLRLPLIPHPDTPGTAVKSIHVSWKRAATGRGSHGLALDYLVEADLDEILLPPRVPWQRRDGLWEHCCFEAFVREKGADGYLEYNLSPSEEWATYRFDAYRLGMRDARAEPMLAGRVIEGMFEMGATFDVDLSRDTVWQLGLAAIIEEKDGVKSYWALAHPPGKPDFHHPDCFVLDLPPPASP